MHCSLGQTVSACRKTRTMVRFGRRAVWSVLWQGMRREGAVQWCGLREGREGRHGVVGFACEGR